MLVNSGYWQRLQADASALPEADRREYYRQCCGSVLSFIAWRHEGISFQEQLAGLLPCPAEPASEPELQASRDEIYVQSPPCCACEFVGLF